jgi:prepilin peptidase CpaA
MPSLVGRTGRERILQSYSLLPHAGVAALLVAAAAIDLRSFTIPNPISVIILVLLPVAWLLGGPVPAPLSSLAAFAAVVIPLGIIWHVGHSVPSLSFGGGDWKLLSALAPWFGLDGLLGLLLATALVGGAETVVLVVLRAAVPVSSRLRTWSWTGPALNAKGIPYGVSIALGGILAIVEVTRISLS